MLDNSDTKKSKTELIAELEALRGELARTARNDMFQAILDNIPLRLTLKDSEGRYVYVNKAMTDAMSMTVEDFIGKTATEAYGDGRGAELDDYVIQVLQTGKAVRGGERPGQIDTDLIYRRDIVPIQIRDGEATHILTISMDVSDRRRVEERLASAVETLSGPFSLWDADERLILCNAKFRTFNHEIADLIKPGVTATEIFGAMVDKGLVSVADGEESAWLEDRLRRFRNPGKASEVKRVGDVWVLAQEYRLGDGSTASVGADVTALKQAEQAVAAQRALLQSLVDAVPLRISLKDAEGRYILVNKPLADAVGMKAEAFVGKSVQDIYGGENGRDYQEQIESVLNDGDAVLEVEKQSYSRPDKTLLRSVIPVRNDAGELQYIVTTALDVTERRRAELALQAQKELLQYVLDNVPARISLKDPDGRYVMVNRELSQVAGKLAEEFIGKTIEDMFPRATADALDGWFAQVLRTGEAVHDTELTSLASPGLPLLRNVAPIKNSAGEVQNIISVAFDISDRVRAEQALAEHRELLQTIIDNLHVKISIRDAEGRYVLANKELCEDMRLAPEDFIGKLSSDIYPGPNGLKFDEDVRRVLETGEAILGREFEGYHEPERTLLQSLVPIRNEDGAVKQLLSVALDVSALKNAERELAKHRDHLAELVDERTEELRIAQSELVRNERLAAIGKLTATISHELRNPLGTIRSSFFTVRSRLTDADEMLTPALERIDRSITRCVDFIEDMLNYTRLRESMPMSTDIDAWCLSLADELEPPDGILLQTDCHSGARVSIDSERMRQAIVNLVQNAWQALENSDTDSDKKSVKLSATIEFNRLVIRVADNGPGIPEDVRDQIFEPLFSTKVYGVGLGLPLVRQIIEEHGGDIRLEPFKVGDGAIFSIALPLENRGK